MIKSFPAASVTWAAVNTSPSSLTTTPLPEPAPRADRTQTVHGNVLLTNDFTWLSTLRRSPTLFTAKA